LIFFCPVWLSSADFATAVEGSTHGPDHQADGLRPAFGAAGAPAFSAPEQPARPGNLLNGPSALALLGEGLPIPQQDNYLARVNP
jgi:hypothetical protein